MLPERPTMEEMEEYFNKDEYATAVTGCKIVEGWKGHGVAEMEITHSHRNAQGNVMGGAIFTLADFALAIASNIAEHPTVNVTSTIDYFSITKGTKLIATADLTKAGNRVAFYDVVVEDDLGVRIAKVSIVGYRRIPKEQR
ncbi:MAG: PaaI family thioesterase [Eggerthellaceae bacterium]|nr:PaaI family thioesterase [Eggerthellaceae bacterium]